MVPELISVLVLVDRHQDDGSTDALRMPLEASEMTADALFRQPWVRVPGKVRKASRAGPIIEALTTKFGLLNSLLENQTSVRSATTMPAKPIHTFYLGASTVKAQAVENEYQEYSDARDHFGAALKRLNKSMDDLRKVLDEPLRKQGLLRAPNGQEAKHWKMREDPINDGLFIDLYAEVPVRGKSAAKQVQHVSLNLDDASPPKTHVSKFKPPPQS